MRNFLKRLRRGRGRLGCRLDIRPALRIKNADARQRYAMNALREGNKRGVDENTVEG